MTTHQLCLCGSKKAYSECCADFHKEIQIPETAEQLMRSRYSAYALKNLQYIQNTMTGKAANGFNLEKAIQNAGDTQWLGLDVVTSYADSKNPNRAFVEFRALYECANNTSIMHELSEFTRIDGKWFYIDGRMHKTSRNDPCPCGSGKKIKKCHITH